jgi:YD repeat-containing protein
VKKLKKVLSVILITAFLFQLIPLDRLTLGSGKNLSPIAYAVSETPTATPIVTPTATTIPTTSTTIPTVTSTATPTTIPTVTPTATPTTIPTVTPTVTANENITSTPANTPTNTPLPVVTHVGGNISQNTIWTNNYTYVVDSTITVQQGVNLQITEGVVVKFSAGTQINVNGILTVAGTEQDNVVFTAIKDAAYGGSGVTASGDYWNGIYVYDTGEFTGDYIKIRYGGYRYETNNNKALNILGKVTLTNSEVSNSLYYGVYINNPTSDVSIQNSRIENSTHTGIYINSTTTGAVTLENNTITGGGNGIIINGYGTGVLNISGNTISNNRGCPIYVNLSGIKSSIFGGIENNTYTGNTTGGITYNGIVMNGVPTVDLTISTAIYYMNSDITVSNGRTMTIQPGAIIKGTEYHHTINVQGKLNALGTQESPIIFTAYKDKVYGGSGVTASGDYWGGINISSTGEFTGDYVKIRYAGNYLTYQGALNVFGKLSLTNSEVSNSWNKGVYFQTTIPPVLLFNAFLANAGEMYNYNSSTMTIDASYNYWNSYFGPSVYNNVTGTWVGDGDKVGSGINYIPWLGSEMKYQFKFGEDGVNSGIGNFSRTYTDLSVKSPGFDISFGRTYNSRNDKITSMGRGWTFSYECRVKDAESSYVQSNGTIASYKIPNYKIVNLPDGSIQTFKENSDGTYTATNSRNKLVKQNGTYVLTTKSQTSFYFNTNGYLVKAQDRNGNAVKLVVDSNGKVQSVTDQADRVFNITYENGNIKTINDIAGNRTVTYEYLNNQLVKVYDPMGHVTNYYYDSEGFLNEIKDQNLKTVESLTYIHTAGENKDKVHTITDAYGNTITYSYDNANMRTTKTDSNGRQTIERYDSSYNVIDSYDPENRVTTYEYYLDSNGENKYSELKSVRDRNGNKTQYQRDGNGNITRIINPDNSTKVMTYDDNNNLTSEMDENGKYTFYVYDDEKKNLVKKVQPLNGTDQYTGTDSSNFAITYYTYYTDAECIAKGYKARGLLKQEIDPEGNITKYEYNANGDVTKVTDPEDNDLNMEYDAVGRKISETTAEGFLTTYTYDKNGKLEKQVQNEGETTRITYDIHGWTTKEVSPNLYNAAMDDIENHAYNDNKGTRYTYYDYGKVNTVTDAEDNTTTYTYDSYGNVITETKPNGSVYIYQYDVMNRLTHVYFKDNAQAAQILLTEYSYTILTGGNMQKTETKYLNDTETAVTVTTYDYAGRQIIQQNPDGTTQSVSYNANGTVNTTTDRAGKVTYYKYDVLNKLTEQWVPFETVNGNIKYSYSKSIYDKAGREIQKIVGKDTVGLYEIPSQLITTNYSYYKNGLVKSVADNEGRTIEYRYDSDGNVSEEKVYTDSNNYITTKYTNNHLNKPTRKEVYAKACDIYGNDINSTAESILTTIYTYDNNGNLLTVKTPDQVTTTYTYDALNRQTGVSQPGTDEYGTSVNIVTSTEYNWEGKVVSTKDANENTTNNSYNQRGLLERVTDAKNNVTAYYYDRAGRKIAEVAPNDFDPAKTLDQLNRVVYTYDKMDRVKTKAYIGDEKVFDAVNNCWITQNVNLIQKAYKYDNNGNVIKELDGLGYEAGTGSDADTKINTGYGTTYTYNLANKVVTILDPVSNERSLSYSTKYSYDALGRKTSETNAKGVITNYYYDDAGKVLAVKVKKTAASDEQAIKSYTYDFIGNVLTQTDGNGNTTTFEYNVFNKIRKAIYPGDTTIPQNTIVYQYDVQGNLKYQKDTKGAVDTYNYDNQGRVISHTQMKQDGTDDITTTFKYDKNGNKRFEVDGNNTQKEFTYNELNQNITESINVSGITQTTTYGFDSNGNKTTLTDWRGRTTTNVYDSLNRLIEKIDAYNISIQKIEYNHNNCQIKSYDALNNITQNTYDKNNRLLSTIDPENHITSQTYDNVGNIDTKKDGENNQTTYTYDEFNRLISVKNAKNENTDYTYDLNGNMLTQTDGKRNVTTFEYNTANKLVKRIDNGGRTGTSGNYVYDMTKVDTYTYNADGSLSQKVDKNNATTTYTYDIHGRLTNQTTVKTGSTTVTISYTYDGNGNRLTVTDSTGTTTRTYDELNRVKTKIVPNIGSTTYTYDIITNVPTGCIGESTTDPKGNITTKVYDKVGRLLTVTADGRTTTYSYFDNGNRQSVTYFNGAKEEYTYYRDNLLWTLTNKKPDGSTMDTYTYTYDAAHNQTSKVEFVNGALKGTTSYTYDGLNRLLSVTEPSGKVTVYTYDAAGNRETETITSGSITTVNTYSYNGQNRLTGIETRVNNVVTETTAYTYDNNGNQLTVSKNSQITATNTYDLINQLTATTTGGKTITNKYNGEGLRVEKSVDGQTTRYLYEYDKVVLEVDSRGIYMNMTRLFLR